MNLKNMIGRSEIVLIWFLSGSQYIWGNYSLYIYSNFQKNIDGSGYFGVFNFAFLFQIFAFELGKSCSIILKNKNYMMILKILCLLFTNIIAFTSVLMQNIFSFLLLFVIIQGFLFGIIMSSFKISGKLNFDKNILIVLRSFYPFIVFLIIWSIINPENDSVFITDESYIVFEELKNENFKKSIFFLAGFNLTLSIISIFLSLIYYNFLRNSEKKNDYLGFEEIIKEESKPLFTWSFLKIFLMCYFTSPFIMYFYIFFKEISLFHHNNDFFCTITGSFALLSYGGGQVLWRKICKIDTNLLFPLSFVITLQCLIGFLFKFAIKSEIFLFILICVIFMNGSGLEIILKKMMKLKYKGKNWRKAKFFLKLGKWLGLCTVLIIHISCYEDMGYCNMIIFNSLLCFLAFIFYY